MLTLPAEPLTLETLTVDILGLPAALDQMRIVQLSDFHYDGQRLSEAVLEEAIATANAAHPDLIVLTGDFVTDEPAPVIKLAARLRRLQSRRGCIAVLGNHDTYFPQAARQISRALTEAGIQVLWNQVAYPLGPGLPVVGLADFWSKEFDPAILASLAPTVPRLVLSHNPDSAAVLQPWRVDLQLSGHTHGGQILLPGGRSPHQLYFQLCRYLPPPLRRRLPYAGGDCAYVVRHWEWAQGLHWVGSNQLYVNRGLGTYWPGRWRCPPEVTLLQLRAAPAS